MLLQGIHSEAGRKQGNKKVFILTDVRYKSFAQKCNL